MWWECRVAGSLVRDTEPACSQWRLLDFLMAVSRSPPCLASGYIILRLHPGTSNPWEAALFWPVIKSLYRYSPFVAEDYPKSQFNSFNASYKCQSFISGIYLILSASCRNSFHFLVYSIVFTLASSPCLCIPSRLGAHVSLGLTDVRRPPRALLSSR